MITPATPIFVQPCRTRLLLYIGFVALSLYFIALSGDVRAAASNLGIALLVHPFAGGRRLSPVGRVWLVAHLLVLAALIVWGWGPAVA